MARPRNPALYAFLQTLPGGVQIRKAGQPLKYVRRDKPDGNYEVELLEGQGGEEYMICCPMCGDKRFRCSVNHMCGEEIEGLTVGHLIHCYNENCKGLFKWFRERYEDFLLGYQGETGVEAPGIGVAKAPEEIALESHNGHARLVGAVPINTLPSNHAAIRYLVERGFSPDMLYQYYHIGFYEGGVTSRVQLARRRIIIPVDCYGMRVGWQARTVIGYTKMNLRDASKAWPYIEPKYFTAPGMIKTGLLYNMDLARQYDVIAVAEGVTDVWKIGPWGVAIFGKTFSEAQITTLCKMGEESGKWFVMLGDAGAQESWYQNYLRLSSRYPYNTRLRLVMFTKGDPGDYGTDYISAAITKAVNGPELTYA